MPGRKEVKTLWCLTQGVRQRLEVNLRLSVVSVFVLQARPMVERQHAVGERARVTPATQTGLQRDRERHGAS